MAILFIEGFDSFVSNTDLVEDGWRATNGLNDSNLNSSSFLFTEGRLNATAFGKRANASLGFGKVFPTTPGFDVHCGFAYRAELRNTGREYPTNVCSLVITNAAGSLQGAVVVTHLAFSDTFYISINTGTVISSVVQAFVSAPAPKWFDITQWNFFELVMNNSGTEAYLYINGQFVVSFLNTNQNWNGGGFSGLYFGVFPNEERFGFPVGAGNNNAVENDVVNYFVDDIIIKETDTGIPMGDYRMNDGAPDSDFSVEFTPTVGATSNFSTLVEAPADGDVTTVSANTAPRTDLYTHSARTSSQIVPANLALKMRIYAKNAVASPVNLVGLLSDGLVTREVGQYPINIQYSNHSLTFTTDANEVPWTKATVEAAIIGFQNKVV